MSANSNAGVFGPSPDPAKLLQLFELANSTDTRNKEAQREIFAYLWETHLPFIKQHARADWGNGISTSDLAMTVITEMLSGMGRFADIDHLCNSFRQRVVGRAIDYRRRRVKQRQAADRLSDARDKAASRSHTDELERLDLVQRMMQALREHNPKWAAATELRYLAADGSETTFKAIGRALGVTDSTAQEWVTGATNWLREQFPNHRLF